MANPQPQPHPLPMAASGGEGSSVCGPGMDGLRGLQVELAEGVLRLSLQGDARGLSRRAAIARGQALRSGLLGAIDAATQGEVRAIVLSLVGWDWALDEDRTATETTAGADAWVAICRRLADVGRPVIATVSGTVAGDAIAGLLAGLSRTNQFSSPEQRKSCANRPGGVVFPDLLITSYYVRTMASARSAAFLPGPRKNQVNTPHSHALSAWKRHGMTLGTGAKKPL